MVAALAEYLLSGDLDAIWEQLSELDLDAIAEAVHCWDGEFDAVRFRAKYRALPSHFQRHTFSSRQRGAMPSSVLPLFFYDGEIPSDLRPRLAQRVHKPA